MRKERSIRFEEYPGATITCQTFQNLRPSSSPVQKEEGSPEQTHLPLESIQVALDERSWIERSSLLGRGTGEDQQRWFPPIHRLINVQRKCSPWGQQRFLFLPFCGPSLTRFVLLSLHEPVSFPVRTLSLVELAGGGAVKAWWSIVNWTRCRRTRSATSHFNDGFTTGPSELTSWREESRISTCFLQNCRPVWENNFTGKKNAGNAGTDNEGAHRLERTGKGGVNKE